MGHVTEVRVTPAALSRNFELIFQSLASEGPMAWLRAGEQRMLIVNTAEGAAEVLVHRSDVLIKPRSQTLETRTPYPERGDASPEFVTAIRKALAAGFSSREGAKAGEIIRDAVNAETMEWKNGSLIRLMPAARRIAIRTAVRGALGSDLGPKAELRFYEFMRWLDSGPRVLPAKRLTFHELRRSRMDRYFDYVTSELVSSAQDGSAINALEMVAPEFRPGLAGELLIATVGPFTQSAGWALARFADDHDEAARLRDEWPATDRTSGFIREVTRLHPTNVRITRAAIEDTSVGGEPVSVNTRVVLNVKAISRDDRYFEDPDRLLPERWLGQRPDKFAYVSFGLGRRRCLGEAFAMSALTALLPAVAEGRSLTVHGPVRVAGRGRLQPAERLRLCVRSV